MSKTALRVTPNFEIEVLEFTDSTSLEMLQTAIGGYIQPIDLPSNLCMWVDEEYLLKDELEPNTLGTAFYQAIYEDCNPFGTIIFGNIVFTSQPDDEGYTQGLSEKAVAKLTELASKSKATLNGLGLTFG